MTFFGSYTEAIAILRNVKAGIEAASAADPSAIQNQATHDNMIAGLNAGIQALENKQLREQEQYSKWLDSQSGTIIKLTPDDEIAPELQESGFEA